ncbi:DUF1631 family protein [Luteimonas soli]|uniref:DUF1631 family protein n=1 Tax=Luteimonas soli TaxID=1648966 RepID=A0ABV7XIB1_9GAMM
MTQHDDFDTLTTPAHGRIGSEAVRTYETIKRHALTEMAGVLSGFWGSIEEQVRLAALAGHDYSANQDDRVAIAALHQRALELATRYRDAIEREFGRWLDPKPPKQQEKSLSLMSEDELEIHLAGQQTTELLDHQFLHPLELMDERLQSLANALGVQGKRSNPMRPEAAVSAFTGLFERDDLSPGLRVMVFRLHEKRLPHALGTIYERTNASLEAAGFGGMGAASKPRQGNRVVHVSTTSAAGGGNAGTGDNGGLWVPDGGVVEHANGPQQAGQFTPGQFAQPVMYQAAAQMMPGGMAAAPGAPQQAGASLASQVAAAAGAVPQAPDFAGRVPRYRDVVREQLRTWRTRQAEASEQAARQAAEHAAADAANHVLGTEDLLNIARMLQRDDPTPFVRALSGDNNSYALAGALRGEILDGIRQLGFDPEDTALSNDEQDAIDLVGILFQSLVEANELMQRARAMYGKLVVPYLKVALTDDSMFNRRSHPARRLLDVLTEACDGNAGETPQDSETLDRAEQAVDRVVTEYDDDQAIFELAASELRDQLDQQRKRSELAEKRTAEAIHGRERLQHARRAAEGLVASRVADRPLTEAIAQFLDGQWRHYLTQTWLRDGADSARHRAAIALGDAMVQVDTDAAHARGAVVADQLLALQAPLVDCYSSCGLDAGSARDSMARIIAALGLPDTARKAHVPHAGDAEGESFDDEQKPAALRVVGGHDALDFDPAIAARMRRLRPGQGLRLVDEDGRETAARVAWISPLTSRLLIVNRRGVRKMVVSPEELAALVGSGHASVRSVDAPFDEAMKHLWQHLNEMPAAASAN